MISTHVLWHILRLVIHSIHGVDVRKLHQRAVRQLPGLVKLAAPQAALEDVQRRHLTTHLMRAVETVLHQCHRDSARWQLNNQHIHARLF